MRTFDILSIRPENSRDIIRQFLDSIDKKDFDIIFPGFYELTDIFSWSITSVSDLIEDIIFYTSKSFCENSKNLLNLYIHFKLGEELKTVSISKHAVEKNEIKSLLITSYDRSDGLYTMTSVHSGHVNVEVSIDLINSLNKLRDSLIISNSDIKKETIWSVKELYETVENLISNNDVISSVIAKLAKKLEEVSSSQADQVLTLSYLIHYMFLDERNLSYFFSAVNQGKGLGGLFVGYNKALETKVDSNYIKNIANNLAIRLTSNSLLKLLHKQTLKTALISILVDSYAHNISAHSLSALKWWFELRHKIADKRFFIEENIGLELSSFQPEKLVIKRTEIRNTAEKYYDALGLTDSVYNSKFSSLFDILNFKITQDNKFFIYEKSNQNYQSMVTYYSPESIGKVSTEEITNNGIGQNGNINIDCFNPRFPVSLDYALFPFFRFLRDKGAFWSGVTRDNTYGGESKTWYQVLWEDFANNPLYLGTIAQSEGITKLKINLALKKNDEWTYGRFVTIDLSLLDYEERIATNPKLKIEYQKQDFVVLEPHLDDMGISTDIRDKERSIIDSNTLLKLDAKLESILLSVNNQEYTKYALIRLGECFARFREIMSSEEYTVFLPGGVVGEHALFTIFENSLRNIKHYKNLDLSKDGIDFWISIEPERLNISSVSTIQQKKYELFKVNVWLGHETRLVQQENGKNISIYEKLSKATDRPIMDSYGVPIMGGNSQDKACAAMLFNNKFGSVEEKGEENKETRDGAYFPWVHFTTNTSSEPYNSEHDLPHSRIKCRLEQLNHADAIKNYLSSLDQNGSCYLKKHFYIWKNDDYLFINNASDLSGENISRFKFVIISSDISDKYEINKIILKARQEGVIRILIDSDNDLKNKLKSELTIPDEYQHSEIKKQAYMRDERLRLLYSFWLQKWTSGDNFNISIYKRPIVVTNFSVTITNDNPYINIEQNCTVSNICIPLSHGGGDEFNSCNVRSHGVFWGKYFNKVEKKQASELFEASVIETLNNDLTKYLLMDFAEVVTTNVFIFDNRIKSRMPINDEKLNVFRKNLKLVVEDEKTSKEKQEGFFSKHLDKLSKQYGAPNILVVHLSYIESLGYNERDRKSMNSFIGIELRDLINKDNFIFIITSGRGRDSWKEGLEEDYFKKTIFKPVESFIHAIESGISYNDNFDVKHNIIKVIFGS